jgi:O-antigen ligase
MLSSSRYRLAVAGFLLLAVALFGGASRIDEPAQLPVRLAAIIVIGASLWPLDFSRLKANRDLVFFSLACLALPLLQLIPLPPALWDRLPGHAVYADIARATGTAGWRPLSLTPDLTINALLALLPPAAAAVAALHLDANGRKALASAFVLAALASAVLGLAQIGASGDAFRLYRNTSENAPVGLFANRNHQAALLACALPLCAAVIPAGRSAGTLLLRYGFMAPAAVAISAVLLLTGSRMGVALWFVAVAGAMWTLRARGFLRLPSSTLAAARWAVAAVAVAGLIAAALLLDRETLVRFSSQDIAADTRWAALPALLTAAASFLPVGAGLGSFASVYPQFEPDALLSTIYLNQAHDEPVQLLIEGGLPALILLLLFAVWWVKTAARITRLGRRTPRRGLPRAAVAVTALLMLSSLVDYPLRTPLLASLFAACCVEMALGARGTGAAA